MNLQISCRGFSLLELMISQSIGLIMLVTFISSLVPYILTMTEGNALALQQETHRYSTDFLRHAVRSSGYVGCRKEVDSASVIDTTNNSISTALKHWAYEDFVVKGFSADENQGIRETLGSAIHEKRYKFDGTAIGDILLLRQTTSRELTLTHHDSNLQQIQFVGDVRSEFEKSYLLEINDCNQRAFLQIDSDAPPAFNRFENMTTVNYSASNSINCGAVDFSSGTETETSNIYLGSEADITCKSRNRERSFESHTFLPDTKAHLIKPMAIYIARDPENNEPTLYQLTTSRDGTRSYSEALVEGIENLRILFGVDQDNDGAPESYQVAKQININPRLWDKVVSLELWLMQRTPAGRGGVQYVSEIWFPNIIGSPVQCDNDNFTTKLSCPFHLEKPGASLKTDRQVIRFKLALPNRMQIR